ncbi:MAG TPA: YgiQ family radical SAM protein [Candidatus Gallacutalibacter pullistercoris]|nr:YgiQ family radical SAM protein [Candidatus Gallacutalibacter pullistercoris]
MAFLPISMEDMHVRGWEEADFVIVTGDAYVDHNTFGTAIISRVLEHAGFRVAILSQPEWRTDEDFKRFGKPRLGFMVNSGNIDSMVAHYTTARKRRSEDAYSPGKKAGRRPDRAVIVYTRILKRLYPEVPVIIGGLEASLRRFAHYDYWDDKIRPSILLDSGADLLSFGMGERQTIEIAQRLDRGEPVSSLTDIRGTCYAIPTKEYQPGPAVDCPSFEQVCDSKREYAISCRKQQDEQDAVRGKRVIQKHGKMLVIQNPPAMPLTQEELDEVYELPYEGTYHPVYETMGGVPAIEEVEFSITHNRGCFGACNFCSIAFHQGRAITTRSEESVVREAQKLTQKPNFKGYIHDVGGPTANFRLPSCKKQAELGLCKGKKCLAPKPCPALQADHSEYLHLLRRLRALPGVKKVFIRSGVRYDYVLQDPDETFLKELVQYHVSGQLRIAPEHCSAAVLDCMGKPHIEPYYQFQKRFYEITKSIDKKQYLVPYLMSSHPGSTLRDAIELSLFLKKEKLHPEQVQDFYPTPGTISTCMFYTGLDPYTLKEIYVPRTDREKGMQRALLQYYEPKNHAVVVRALKEAGRTDLIGYGPDCLVKPLAGERTSNETGSSGKSHRSAQKNEPRKNARRGGETGWKQKQGGKKKGRGGR